MSNPIWLTDAPMARLHPLFPKNHSKPIVDDRRVLANGVFAQMMDGWLRGLPP
jgi:hypothetical protein